MNYNRKQLSEKEVSKINNSIEEDFKYKFKKIKGCVQTHSDNVVIIDESNIDKDIVNCNGLITNLKSVALIMKTADCQSIILYDPINNVIGNIHSGWKGTLNKIIINAINLMITKFNSKPKDIIACISPSIRQCCFEVDEDVYVLFKNKFNNIDKYVIKNNNKYYIDTVKLNIDVMIESGLLLENIDDSKICTKCNSDIYIHIEKIKNYLEEIYL